MLAGAAAVLFFVSLWIILPAPTLALLSLGVIAPELSPLLFVAAVVLVGVGFSAPAGGIKRAAQCLAAMAAILYAVPLALFPMVVGRFDEAISVLGNERPSPAASPAAQGHLRSRPLIARDLLLGIGTGESRVARGIEFAAPAGTPLTLDIYRPTSAGRFPVIIQIHGGAWQRGTPGDDAAFAKYFASRGYVVFAIDYRRAPQWQWPAQIEDVRAALAWIRGRAAAYDGDVTRTALIGRSAGAQLALMAAYLTGSPNVAAVVSYYGPTNLLEGWRAPPRPDPLRVRPVLEAYLGGTPDRVSERYREASPVTYVSAAVPPTLLVYGARDHIVDTRFGRELHERLRAAGATSVLLEIPWAEHAFDALPAGLSGQLSLYYAERFLAWALRR